VRDIVADGGGDPLAGLADAALVAGGAEVARLAGEGEEFLVPAIGTMEAGEPRSEIATTDERADGGHGLGAQRSHCAAMAVFVTGEEIFPGKVDDLPEGRGTGTADVVDRRHKSVHKNTFLP
jgi:hypothetical protein